MSSATVCLDARMIRASGIGTYLQGLLTGIERQKSDRFSLCLLGDARFLPTGPWTAEALSSPIYSVREQWEVSRAVKRTKGVLLHSPHYNMPALAASQTVVTVHDLIHLKFPQYWSSPVARAYAYFFFYHVVPKARRILTVSENTKRDLMELLSIPENRITVTYPAVEHERYQTESAASKEAFQRLGLPKDYLLYVGNLKEFKNVRRLVEAYRSFSLRHADVPTLVMVGRNFIPGFDQVIAMYPKIRWIGEVERDLLPFLYRNALTFIFPSLYEGFGLPPLEAMASGTPVICSNRASLPEVVGNAAFLINPESVEEISSAMQRLTEDASLRRELSQKGLQQATRFSWDAMAQKTLNVYAECLS